MDRPNPNRIIRPKELGELLGVTKVTIWRMTRRHDIPPPLRFSANCTGWRESTINSWLDEREAEAQAARSQG